MNQKISIKIAERTFNLTAKDPEQEEVIRLAAESINRHLETYSRSYPGKTMQELLSIVALNECASRISLQREKSAREAEAGQLVKDMADYLAQMEK